MRQYIGARYTIKIYENSLDPSSAEWEENGTYEPFTMVTYLNSSYLSKKDVPPTVGNPADNPSYWVITGAYNGQIAALQSQIDDINDNKLPAITSDITDLESDVSDLKRKAIYIGNSYAQGVGSTSGTDGIYALTKDMFEKSELYADGGVGFLTYTGHTVTFEDLLDDAIADTSTWDSDEVTDIIILSAWGDTLAVKNRGIATATSDLASALSSFVTKAKNAYPNLKKLSLSFVETRSHRTIAGTSEGTSLYNEPFDCHWLLSVLAPRNGMEYLGWVSWESFMVNTSFTASDYYHPSDLGYKVMSTNFRQAYWSNYKSAVRYTRINNMSFPITTGSIADVYCKMTPDESVIEIGRVNIASGSTAAQYTSIDLVDFSTAGNTILVPPMPLGKMLQANNLDVIPDADLSHNIPHLLTLQANSEGSVKFAVTTFNASEALSARSNAHCLENVYQIVNAL